MEGYLKIALFGFLLLALSVASHGEMESGDTKSGTGEMEIINKKMQLKLVEAQLRDLASNEITKLFRENYKELADETSVNTSTTIIRQGRPNCEPEGSPCSMYRTTCCNTCFDVGPGVGFCS